MRTCAERASVERGGTGAELAAAPVAAAAPAVGIGSGSGIRSGSWTNLRANVLQAQINEVLLKCVCDNLSVLVHVIHELRIEPTFWSRLEVT